MEFNTLKLRHLICIALLTAPACTFANDIGVAICQSVINNDKHGLRLALRSGNYKLRSIYSDMRCNDKTLVQVALENNAIDTGDYIISKVSKSTLEDAKDLEWANANGYSSSPLVTKLKERIE